MDYYYLLKGVLIGLFLAIPVGPTVLLCIRHSLVYGMQLGFMTGLGAAFADALYGIIAGYGIYAINLFFDEHHFLFHVIGSSLLFYLGIKTYIAKPTVDPKEKKEKRPTAFSLCLATFTLTATSPLTLVGVTALCAAVGVDLEDRTAITPWILSLGIFIGSAIWWIILSTITALFKDKMNQRRISWLNKISGVFLILLGVAVMFYNL